MGFFVFQKTVLFYCFLKNKKVTVAFLFLHNATVNNHAKQMLQPFV